MNSSGVSAAADCSKKGRCALAMARWSVEIHEQMRGRKRGERSLVGPSFQERAIDVETFGAELARLA